MGARLGRTSSLCTLPFSFSHPLQLPTFGRKVRRMARPFFLLSGCLPPYHAAAPYLPPTLLRTFFTRGTRATGYLPHRVGTVGLLPSACAFRALLTIARRLARLRHAACRHLYHPHLLVFTSWVGVGCGARGVSHGRLAPPQQPPAAATLRRGLLLCCCQRHVSSCLFSATRRDGLAQHGARASSLSDLFYSSRHIAPLPFLPSISAAPACPILLPCSRIARTCISFVWAHGCEQRYLLGRWRCTTGKAGLRQAASKVKVRSWAGNV